MPVKDRNIYAFEHSGQCCYRLRLFLSSLKGYGPDTGLLFKAYIIVDSLKQWLTQIIVFQPML